MICYIKKITWYTPNIMALTCTPQTLHSFCAGQYAMLKTLDMPEPRAYSIASPEYEDDLTFHIRIASDSPTMHALSNLKSKDEVEVTGVGGINTLDKNSNKPLFLIAGGVGVAPLYSIIMTAYKHQPNRNITLYWGCDTKEDLYLDDTFLTMMKNNTNFSYISVCDDYITDYILDDIKQIKESIVHIAGPKQMMQITLDILATNDVDKNSIFHDKLW